MNYMSLTDDELVNVVKLNGNATPLNISLVERLAKRIENDEMCEKEALTALGDNDVKTWLIKELTEISRTLNTLQSNDHSELTVFEFDRIMKSLSNTENLVTFTLGSDCVRITDSYQDEPDLVAGGHTPIFSNYWTVSATTSFEDYFNTNLNPDESVPGFLEQLDSILQIVKHRPLIIYTTGDIQELNFCATITNYIKTQF